MMLFMPSTSPVNVTVSTRLLSLSIKHLDIWLDSFWGPYCDPLNKAETQARFFSLD